MRSHCCIIPKTLVFIVVCFVTFSHAQSDSSSDSCNPERFKYKLEEAGGLAMPYYRTAAFDVYSPQVLLKALNSQSNCFLDCFSSYCATRYG